MDPAANMAFEWLGLWKRRYCGVFAMERLFRMARSVGVSFLVVVHDDVVVRRFLVVALLLDAWAKWRSMSSNFRFNSIVALKQPQRIQER